jgi:hypothetical protein
MIYHESLTFGRHYEPAGQDNPGIARLRTQGSSSIVNDPVHNPNLSLKLHSEWQLAFPPLSEPG